MIQTENLTAKEQLKINAIIENLELAKIIMYVYRGQTLELDIKDFCMKYKVFYTEDAFDYAIEQMLKANVIKRVTYPNTANIVIVAKKSLNRFMCKKDDSIEFSSKQVKLNSFLTSLILKHIEKPQNCNVTTLINNINSCSTFLNQKYDIKSGYDFFKKHFKTNSAAELEFRSAMYRSIKGLKNIKLEEYSKEDELHKPTNSFATFVNKNIYTLYKDDICTFFILDLSDNMNAAKIGANIGFTVSTLFEQLEEAELLQKLKLIEFKIIARDDDRKETIASTFKKAYYKEHTSNIDGKTTKIKIYKEHLLDAINKAARKRTPCIKVNYIDKNKESDDIFEFRNSYESEFGLNINIKVINANLNDRLTIHTRVLNVKTARKIKHEKELEAKLRKKIEHEIEEKIRKEYELIYSAREEEIRKQIKREYNINYPIVDDEIDYL